VKLTVNWPTWLAVAGLLAALGWLVHETEWVEVEESLPARSEAARHPSYAAQRLLAGLGVQAVRRDNLDAMPPPGATLVLSSMFWSLLPERDARLRDWVERQGGHLVVPAMLINRRDRDAHLPWVPVVPHDAPRRAPAASAPAAGASAALPASSPAPTRYDPEHDCETLHEPHAVPATFAPQRDYRACVFTAADLRAAGATPQWVLRNARDEAAAMRVPVGAGSVTVFANWTPFHSRGLLWGDNAAAFYAGLGAPGPGAQVWFVEDETREPVLAWLWQSGAIVVVLGALALAAALWRQGLRFGPLAAPEPTGRRSMAEQVRGTAEFVWQHEAAALHAAQLRALDEAARRVLHHPDRLTRTDKAAAIAHATGLDADELGRALDGRIARPRAAWPAVYALLESARRRLRDEAARRRRS